MPAVETNDPARRGKLLQGLFWGGVGLAPLTILVLLFGGSLRIAVLLSVLTIVALAISIALRPSVEMVRVDIEHRVLDEVERVRAHSREDVTVAARNTHRALSEKIRSLTETIEALREQLDEVQHSAMLQQAAVSGGGTPAATAAAAPGVVHRTETVHVTRRTTTVGEDRERTGTVYGTPSAIPASESRYEPPRHGSDSRHDADSRYADSRRSEPRYDDHRYDDDRGRHEDHRYDSDRRHESDRRDDDRRYDEDRRHDAERRHDDRRDDRRYDEDRRRDDDRRYDERDERRPDDRGRGRDDDRRREDDRDGSWTSSGDRWASVRSDDRGRELRMGERRSTVRSDDRGTEYRVEDRWAALRREDEPGDGWESTFRSLSGGPIAALPASRGETAARYLDEDRDDYSAPRSRGRVREAERERERAHDDRDRDDRGRDDRGRDDRGRDERRYDDDRGRDAPRQRGSYDDYR